MRKILLVAGLLFLVLSLSLVVLGRMRASAQAASPTSAPSIDAAGNASGVDAESPTALTSFQVSNPYCYQPDPTVDQCAINFRFIQASDNQSSSPYMTWLSISILNKDRYTSTAFFEGTITYSYDMVPGGLKVACGLPNAGGAGTQYGNVFGVKITPLDSSRNSMSTDIANVTCPAFAP